MNEEFLLRRSAQMVVEDPKQAREVFHEVAESAAPLCPSCKRPVKHRQGLEWCQDMQMSEATLQDRVRDRAKRRHWVVAHAGKGWVGDQETGAGQFVTPMAPGWPDLMLFKPDMPGHKVVAMELKSQKGEVSPDQWTWIELLNACGIPAVVIRPSDLRSGAVNAILEGR
jgi:hypothetical protein